MLVQQRSVTTNFVMSLGNRLRAPSMENRISGEQIQVRSKSEGDQRGSDMRHKMLTQRTPFVLRVMAKRYAESAFPATCRTSPGGGGGGGGLKRNLSDHTPTSKHLAPNYRGRHTQPRSLTLTGYATIEILPLPLLEHTQGIIIGMVLMHSRIYPT